MEWISSLSVLSLIIILGLQRLNEQSIKIKRLESKIDILMRHLDVNYDPVALLPREVIEAKESGQRIRAIRLYRQFSGASLREARSFIDDLK
ncbi:hypothetical protein DU002_14275 [Corallincola holothuriorum]|uniref:Ribosomal protein L7/L12 C-terminal domain-containing protein n=1 Tax=Corallincola holothuriorum TaxID=2282215 RepID=A0A368N540_9GAMM|nr:hypothetical protein DU002_14275 [Corallincola holothuriorum]